MANVDEEGDVVAEVIGVEGVSFHEVLNDFNWVVRGVEVANGLQEIGQLVVGLDAR